MDDDEVVGELDIEMKDLFAKEEEQGFNEEFEYNNEVNAGSIKFQTIATASPVFSEIKTIHRKKKKGEEGGDIVDPNDGKKDDIKNENK